MNPTEQLALLRELLACLENLEELEPHFTNRRRIKELQEQIKDFK